MKIVERDLYSVLLKIRDTRKQNNEPTDPILEEIIEDFHSTAHGCARDARKYLKDNNIDYSIKRQEK